MASCREGDRDFDAHLLDIMPVWGRTLFVASSRWSFQLNLDFYSFCFSCRGGAAFPVSESSHILLFLLPTVAWLRHTAGSRAPQLHSEGCSLETESS